MIMTSSDYSCCSRLARVLVASGWLVIGFAIAAVSSLLLSGPNQTVPTVMGLLVGAGIAICGGVYSIVRLNFVVTDTGLTINNAIRSWHVAWGDVAEIGVKYIGLPTAVGTEISWWRQGKTPPAVGVARRDGRYVPAAHATAYMSDELLDRTIEVLASYGQKHGFQLSLSKDNYSRWRRGS